MANGFVTDYSFLNLPEKGSAARGPIELPSFEPVDYLSNIDFYAPRTLPETELVAPSPVPLSEQENLDLLSQARPFEDIAALGAAAGQRMAEVEKFFGDKVNNLQGTISDLENQQGMLNQELQAAVAEQDNIRQQSAEQQLQALDQQRQELEAELQQAVAEAEAQGVDALNAAKADATSKIEALNQQIAQVENERQAAIAEQDVIRQQESERRLAELEQQRSQLTSQFQEQTAQLEQKFASREAELTGQIGNLQNDINALTGARDQAIAERDQAIAEQDTIRAQAADSQAQALDAQRSQLLSERENLLSGKDTTIADLQAQIAALQQTPVEGPSVISEQPETPFDQYLRDQERIDAAVGMMPGGDAIQKGIEELYGRVTAGGGKPEDFKIYQPPVEMTPPAPPSDGKLYAGGSPGLYEPGGKFNPGQELPSLIVSQPPKPLPRPVSQPGIPVAPMAPSLSNLGSTSIANDGTLGDAPLGLEDLLFQPPARPIDFMPDPRLRLRDVPPKPILRPVSPIVSQPPRTIPTTAPRIPIPTRPSLPIRPMGRFAGGGLVDMIQMRLNRMR